MRKIVRQVDRQCPSARSPRQVLQRAVETMVYVDADVVARGDATELFRRLESCSEHSPDCPRLQGPT